MTGPRLVATAAVAIAVMCVALVIGYGPGPEAAHAVVRWTARTSLIAFVLAYVARPLVQLRPTRETKAILAQRKWIGLCFATSHLAHLIGIIAIAWPDPGAFVRSQDPSIIVAAATFVLLFAMAITSREDIKRKMSATAWKRLHRTGIHFAWVAFTATYLPAISASPFYAIPAVILLAIGGIRATAWLRGKRRARAHSDRARSAA